MQKRTEIISSSSSKDIITFFPLDLIVDILRRLPLRILFRCSILSKPWRDHLVPFAVSVCHQKPDFALISGPIPPGSVYHLIVPESKKHVPLKQYHSSPKLVLSDACNGFLLLRLDNISKHCFIVPDHFVVNPLTSKSIKLPCLDDNLEPFQSSMLAFDPSVSPYYKVIMCFGRGKTEGEIKKFYDEIHIFSSKTGRWSSSGSGLLGPPNVNVAKFSSGTTICVNGYTYQLSFCDIFSYIYYVMSFHVEEERFEFITCPKCPMTHSHRITTALGVAGRCLQYTYYDGRNMSIWKLEDHNSHNWTQTYIIDMKTMLKDVVPDNPCTVACHGEEEALYFVGYGYYLFRYELKAGRRRVIGSAFKGNLPAKLLSYHVRLPALVPFLCCLNDPRLGGRIGPFMK